MMICEISGRFPYVRERRSCKPHGFLGNAGSVGQTQGAKLALALATRRGHIRRYDHFRFPEVSRTHTPFRRKHFEDLEAVRREWTYRPYTGPRMVNPDSPNAQSLSSPSFLPARSDGATRPQPRNCANNQEVHQSTPSLPTAARPYQKRRQSKDHHHSVELLPHSKSHAGQTYLTVLVTKAPSIRFLGKMLSRREGTRPRPPTPKGC
jgi:hypothetical protein